MKIALLLVGLFITSSCQTFKPPQYKKVTNETVSDFDFDKSWNIAIDYLNERNLNIKTIDRASGLIILQEMNFDNPSISKEIIDCGQITSGLSPLRFSGAVNATVRIKKDDNNKVNVQYLIRGNSIVYFQTASSGSYECYSTGEAENRFLSRFKK